MDHASRLRVVPVGASDEEFFTIVEEDSAIVLLQFIRREGKVRVLGGESNDCTYRILDAEGKSVVECGPGGELTVPMTNRFTIEVVARALTAALALTAMVRVAWALG